MGNAQPITQQFPWDFVEGPTDSAPYDQAGFVPPGLTYAPQRAWNEAENYGLKHMVTPTQILWQTGSGGGTAPSHFQWGATEGIGTGFGALQQQARIYDTSYLPDPSLGHFIDGMWSNVPLQPQPYSTWKRDPNAPIGQVQLCDPATYPNCTMLPMVAAAAEATGFDQVTRNAATVYREGIDRAYQKAFIGGGIEALRNVNSAEHSTYDPCDNPSLFEVLFPLVVAGGSGLIFARYVEPVIVQSVDSTGVLVLQIGVISFGYNIARAFIEFYREPSSYYNKAAASLLYPGAYLLGTALGAQLPQQFPNADPTTLQYAGVGATVLLAHKCVPAVGAALKNSTYLAAIILGSFGFLTHAASRLWCQLTSNLDACSQYEGDFQDNRRWDAVSLAALLTLEVCEREGWAKDSLQAEFVFRGLLTGPSLMNAPIDTTQPNDTVWDETLANPLGYLYEGRWQQNLYPVDHFTKGTGPQSYQRSDTVVGWDAQVAGVADIATKNLYACENWDLLRNGTQTNNHPGAKRVAQKFNEWIGKWDDPENYPGALVQAAQDPNNLKKMENIPGWEFAHAIPLIYHEALKNTTGVLKEAPFIPEVGTPVAETSAYIRNLEPETPLTDLTMRFAPEPIISRYDPQACDDLWNDLRLGSGGWQTANLAEIHDGIVALLHTQHGECTDCDVETRGHLEALRLAISYNGVTNACAQWQTQLGKLGWNAAAQSDALWGVLQCTNSANPELAQFATDFIVAGCYEQPHVQGGIATLPPSVTNSWCA